MPWYIDIYQVVISGGNEIKLELLTNTFNCEHKQKNGQNTIYEDMKTFANNQTWDLVERFHINM